MLPFLNVEESERTETRSMQSKAQVGALLTLHVCSPMAE